LEPYASKVPDAGSAANVARSIDQLFDPRDIQTLSMSERAMNTSFIGMISAVMSDGTTGMGGGA
jgi:putative ABC transport system permease protein